MPPVRGSRGGRGKPGRGAAARGGSSRTPHKGTDARAVKSLPPIPLSAPPSSKVVSRKSESESSSKVVSRKSESESSDSESEESDSQDSDSTEEDEAAVPSRPPSSDSDDSLDRLRRQRASAYAVVTKARSKRRSQRPVQGQSQPTGDSSSGGVNDEDASCLDQPQGAKLIRRWGARGPTLGCFEEPYDIAADVDCNLYVADASNHRIQIFSSSGAFLRSFGRKGTEPGEFRSPSALCTGQIIAPKRFRRGCSGADAESGTSAAAPGEDRMRVLVVCDSDNHRVQCFELREHDSGDSRIGRQRRVEPVLVFGECGREPGCFVKPSGVVIVEDRIFVSDKGNHRVQVFDSEGQWCGGWGAKGPGSGLFNHPVGMTVSKLNELYVADSMNGLVQVFDTRGRFVRQFGGRGVAPGSFMFPRFVVVGVAPGLADDEDEEVVAVSEVGDKERRRVQFFTVEGEYLSQFGRPGLCDGCFREPAGVAAHDGSWYVVDRGGASVQAFEALSKGAFDALAKDAAAALDEAKANVSSGAETATATTKRSVGKDARSATRGEASKRGGRSGGVSAVQAAGAMRGRRKKR